MTHTTQSDFDFEIFNLFINKLVEQTNLQLSYINV